MTATANTLSAESSAPPLELELDCPQKQALVALEAAAEAWGADWVATASGGKLEIPVTAGVRHGFVDAQATVTGAGRRATVRLDIQKEDYRLHGSSVAVLVMGAAGGLGMMLLPFFPQLFDFLPFAGISMLLAWFVVVARVRHRSPGDFLETVRDAVSEEWQPQRDLAEERRHLAELDEDDSPESPS